MKTICIATVAILGCASAAPQRMRVRDLEGSLSMPELTEVAPSAPAAETPVTLPEEISMPAVEESMSAPAEVLPEDVVTVAEVLYESMSIPEIFEELHGSISMPDGWSPEEEGLVPAEDGQGYVSVASDDTTEESDDTTGDDPTGDDVTEEETSSASVVSAAVSAACVVGAMALF